MRCRRLLAGLLSVAVLMSSLVGALSVSALEAGESVAFETEETLVATYDNQKPSKPLDKDFGQSVGEANELCSDSRGVPQITDANSTKDSFTPLYFVMEIDVPQAGTYTMTASYRGHETGRMVSFYAGDETGVGSDPKALDVSGDTRIGQVDMSYFANGNSEHIETANVSETGAHDAAANQVELTAGKAYIKALVTGVGASTTADHSRLNLDKFTLTLVEAAAEEPTLPAALVHYDFEDAATDISGNGNNGRPGSDVTIANGIATFAGGKNDKSVIVIDNPIAKRENLTVSAMVKVDSQPTNWAALWEAWTSKEDGKLIRFALRNDDEGAITVQTRTLVNGGGSLTNTTDAATMMPVGEWAELTFVSEGDTIRIYLNGKLLVEGSKTGDPAIKISASDLNEAAKIYIGRDPQWEDPGFAGQMSDFRVYNQALTADQIAAVYAENLEEFAFNPGERPADEAAGAVYDQIMALPDTITYKQGNEIRQARADYNALTAEQQEMLSEELMQKLSAAEESLQAVYDAFTFEVTVEDMSGGVFSKTPWLNADQLTDEQKQQVADSLTEEAAQAVSGMEGSGFLAELARSLTGRTN